MVISLIKEADEVRRQFGGLVEYCHFCHEPTLYWHENTNNPVCPGCAKKHKVAELPDHGQRVRAAKRKARKAAVKRQHKAINAQIRRNTVRFRGMDGPR